LHNVVIASERQVRGATFETSDLGPVLSSGDSSFRPVYIANAPDGSLFVADFYEHYIAHGQHYQSQIDPTTGRIYRLRGKEARLERDIDLSRKSAGELVELLGHPNKWHRHTAVRLLGERKEEGVVADLKILLAQGAGPGSWGALWALHQMNALDDGTWLEALGHPDAPVRKWAVRFAGDKWGRNPGLGLGPAAGSVTIRELPSEVAAALLEQAVVEGDAEVRAQIAASARRLAVWPGLPLVRALLEKEEDQNDPFIPLLCWWALEHHFSRDRGEVLALFKEPALWEGATVFEHILPRLMRRAAAEGRRQDLLIGAELLRMAPSPAHADQLLKGFEEGYRGRPMTGFPDELISALAASGKSSLMLRLRQGHPGAVSEALSLLKNSQNREEDRLPLTRAMGELRIQESIPTLLALVESDSNGEIRKAALASLAVFDEEKIPARIHSILPDLPEALRSAAYLMLSSRSKWADDFLESMEAGRIGLSTVPAEIADRLLRHPEELIRIKASRLFPRNDPEGAADFSERLGAVEEALRGGPGNPYKGEQIYTERCASCHKLFHKGGNAGPDLTQYQRNHLGTLLVSIIQPNAEIREGYEAYEIEMEDGRTLTGFLTDRDGQVLVLRMLDGQDVSLPVSEIAEIQPTGRSLMPEGLLDGLSEQQLRDFFAYLRSSQPFTR
jgi:putative heme-binding domain-containing protein